MGRTVVTVTKDNAVHIKELGPILCRVRTPGGAEGYILSAWLSCRPSVRSNMEFPGKDLDIYKGNILGMPLTDAELKSLGVMNEAEASSL